MKPPLPVRRTRATAALTEPLVIIPSNILKAIIKDEPLDQIDESTSGGTTLDPFQDTTDRHKSHLFDPNFRICSGQVKPKDDVIKVSSKTTSPGRKTNSDKKSSSSRSRKNLKEYKDKERRGSRDKDSSIDKGKDRRDSKEKDRTEKERDRKSKESKSVIIKEGLVHKPEETCGSQSGIEDFSELIVSSAEATPSSIQAVETHLVHPAKPEEDEPIVVEPTFAISTTTPEQTSSQSPPSPEPVKTVVATPLDLSFRWKGVINASGSIVNVQADEISCGVSDLAELGLPSSLDLIGRTRPEMVWDYVNQARQTGSRDVIAFRIAPAADVDSSDRQLYSTYLGNLHKSDRFDVVRDISKFIKGFYIIPLPKDSPIPVALTALSPNMKAFDENRTSQLLGVVVRIKRKRPEELPSSHQAKMAKTMTPDLSISSSNITPPGSSTSSPALIYIPTIRSSQKEGINELMLMSSISDSSVMMETEEEAAVEDEEGEDEDGVGDEDPVSDPGKLWCVCREPHNNRFMICCDKCEDWFHGTCVGVTRAMGRQLEAKGLEWICLNCVHQEYAAKQQTLQDDVLDSPGKKKREKEAAEKSAAAKTQDPVVKLDVVKENAAQVDQKKNRVKQTSTSDVNSTRGAEPEGENGSEKRKCVLPNCKSDARPNSVYCGDKCIMVHARESLLAISKVALASEKQQAGSSPSTPNTPPGKWKESPEIGELMSQPTPTSTKSKLFKKPANLADSAPVPVMERRTGKILMRSNAPKVAQLEQWLKEHPTYEVIKPSTLPAKNRISVPVVRQNSASQPGTPTSSAPSPNKPLPQAEPENGAVKVNSSNNASNSFAQEFDRTIQKERELKKTNEPAQMGQLPTHSMDAEKLIIEVNCPLPLSNTAQSKVGRRKRSEPVTDSSSCSQIPSKKKKPNEVVHTLLEEKNKNMQLLRSRIESMKSVKCTAVNELNLVLSRKLDVQRRIEQINKENLEAKLELNALKSSSGSDSTTGNGKNRFEVKINLLEETIKKLEREFEMLRLEEKGLIVGVENAERFLLGASQVLQAIELELVKLDLP